MGTKNNNNLFFTCSLIEYMGRLKKKTRCDNRGPGQREHRQNL